MSGSPTPPERQKLVRIASSTQGTQGGIHASRRISWPMRAAKPTNPQLGNSCRSTNNGRWLESTIVQVFRRGSYTGEATSAMQQTNGLTQFLLHPVCFCARLISPIRRPSHGYAGDKVSLGVGVFGPRCEGCCWPCIAVSSGQRQPHAKCTAIASDDMWEAMVFCQNLQCNIPSRRDLF